MRVDHREDDSGAGLQCLADLVLQMGVQLMLCEDTQQAARSRTDQQRQAKRGRKQPDKGSQPGAHTDRNLAMPVGGLNDLSHPVGVVTHQRGGPHLHAVFEPALHFVEVDLSGFQIAVRRDENQFVIVVAVLPQHFSRLCPPEVTDQGTKALTEGDGVSPTASPPD